MDNLLDLLDVIRTFADTLTSICWLVIAIALVALLPQVIRDWRTK